ncbi:MAG TPA: carboxylesterase family protein [Burkholderiaceae bacterium]|nr:carboxylesterase family protein [Burkholderiaceae bacterium]
MKNFYWPTALVRALTGAALLAGLAACGSDDDGTVVSTSTGIVEGVENANSYSFLGIPYAAPPVGALRWRAPAAATAWTDVRPAKAFGPHCAQVTTPFGTASTSEDCLYLNVYTPKGSGPFPVMVWIHGGAFYLGQSDAYDPARLVAQGNVVVTINYRLGALGFMSHPALSAEQGGTSGNYGLMDQQAALRWVRANIANFGGNANNVTIFGESAGGFSVHSHLASPGSVGLFNKAIIMSGGYALGAGAQDTLAAAETKGATVAASAAALISAATNTTVPACTTAACLRALPASVLLGAQMAAWPSGPVPSVDGTVLTKSVRQALIDGTYTKVPLIQGTTADEWRLFVALDEIGTATTAKPYLGTPLNATTYPQSIVGTFPFLAGQQTALSAAVYPASGFGGNYSVAMGALGTDLLFTCNARWSSKQQKAGASVYAYEFADRTVPALFPVSFPMGAAHTTELNYLFNIAGKAAPTATQQVVADAIVGYWSRFAATGNPNTTAAPTAWPALGTTESVMQFGDTANTLVPDAAFTATHRCSTVWTPGV